MFCTGKHAAHQTCAGAHVRTARCVIAQDCTARLWDERVQKAATVFTVRQPAHCAAVAELIEAVLVGDECGAVTVFDRRRPSSPLYALKAHKDVARRLAVSKARASSACLREVPA